MIHCCPDVEAAGTGLQLVAVVDEPGDEVVGLEHLHVECHRSGRLARVDDQSSAELMGPRRDLVEVDQGSAVQVWPDLRSTVSICTPVSRASVAGLDRPGPSSPVQRGVARSTNRVQVGASLAVLK